MGRVGSEQCPDSPQVSGRGWREAKVEVWPDSGQSSLLGQFHSTGGAGPGRFRELVMGEFWGRGMLRDFLTTGHALENYFN